MPFFSVVIPTKNRPAYLRDAIRSVLLQNFDDFELIVSDNFNDQTTIDVCRQFEADKRVKYYRTSSELNMIDHWEWATTKASGQYVVLLPDRKLLYKGALKKIHKAINSAKIPFNCISYEVRPFDDDTGTMMWYHEGLKSKVFDSAELLENFISQNYFTEASFDIYFPKTLNSCYKNSYAARIRKMHGSYFNIKGVTTPDYSSFFVNVLSNENILFVKGPIILSQGEGASNGRNFGKGKTDAYLKTLGDIDPTCFVPIKAPFIYNWLINDLQTIHQKINGRNSDFDKVNYYATCKFEYDRFKKDDTGENNYFLNELNNALQSESPNVQEQVQKEIASRKSVSAVRSNVSFNRLYLHVRDYLIHNYGKNRIVNSLYKRKFSSALEAAGYKNTHAF